MAKAGTTETDEDAELLRRTMTPTYPTPRGSWEVLKGRFLSRNAIIDVIKSEQRTNSRRKRRGEMAHPLRFTLCGCPDPSCGGWHHIDLSTTSPTIEECAKILMRKFPRKVRKREKRLLRRFGPSNP